MLSRCSRCEYQFCFLVDTDCEACEISLNSRKFSATRGMEIFDAARFGPGIIARANHIAAVERWNAPQVCEAALDVRVLSHLSVLL